MKRNIFLPVLILIAGLFFVSSCDLNYKREAIGKMGKVVVVMDSTKWDSPTAEAIRRSFGEYIMTLPQPEPKFDLKFADFDTRARLQQIKKMKNIIFAAALDEQTNVGRFMRNILSKNIKKQVRAGKRFAFPVHNKWYSNQWVLFLTAMSHDSLAAKIRRNEERLVGSLMDMELQRWKARIYERGEKFAIEDTLWKKHGWKIRVQHDYRLHVDTSNFVTLRRYLPKNDRWIWVYWKNNVTNPSFVDSAWINNTRDSLMKKYIRGTRDSSYVTTEYRRPVKTEVINLNGYYAWRTRGTWRMTHDFMGGPFINYTIYDDATNRLFMLEFSQFAPKYDKRRFIRQFMAMAHTFKSDSSWQPVRPEGSAEPKKLKE